MGVVSWDGGRVSIRASVQVPRAITGAKLRDSYIEAIKTQTLGLARFRDGSIMLGPLTLLRFGPPKVTRNAERSPAPTTPDAPWVRSRSSTTSGISSKPPPRPHHLFVSFSSAPLA